jgi:arylformamidase
MTRLTVQLHHLCGDTGCIGPNPRQRVHNQPTDCTLERRKAHGAGRRTSMRGERAASGAEFRLDTFCVTGKFERQLGWHQPTTGPVEQQHADLTFQRTDLLRHGLGCQVQHRSRLHNTPRTHYRKEDTQAPRVDLHVRNTYMAGHELRLYFHFDLAHHCEMPNQLIDLSHVISEGMVTYPGMPGPVFGDHLTREDAKDVYGPGVTFHIGRISMVANTGTYLDSPYHRFADGTDLAGLSLTQLANIDGVVVRVVGSGRRSIEASELAAYDVRNKAVLLHTGWDRHWNTEQYGRDATFLSAGATQWLIDNGAALVGIDSVNIDDMGDLMRPAHSGLLGASIPIVEHLRGLDQLPTTGFRFHAAPPAIVGFGTFPVRAYAVLD